MERRAHPYRDHRVKEVGGGRRRIGHYRQGDTQKFMGRTVLPYSQVLEREYQDWKKFRRGLRREDQVILDRLFDLARLHVQAGSYASRPWPLETILISVLIEQEKALAELKGKVQVLEEARAGGRKPDGALLDPGIREGKR